jgi:pSer/pThr/pTyr-binding forkhead associated (FHA) protein
VQDLDSTNGTYVNGARVMGAQRLDAGDVLRVGETDLRVEED